jgi:hypothetical protein
VFTLRRNLGFNREKLVFWYPSARNDLAFARENLVFPRRKRGFPGPGAVTARISASHKISSHCIQASELKPFGQYAVAAFLLKQIKSRRKTMKSRVFIVFLLDKHRYLAWSQVENPLGKTSGPVIRPTKSLSEIFPNDTEVSRDFSPARFHVKQGIPIVFVNPATGPRGARVDD